jgi:hypothetical protein
MCVVPAAGVVAEAMVALTIARLAQEKFGGDSALELQRNFAVTSNRYGAIRYRFANDSEDCEISRPGALAARGTGQRIQRRLRKLIADMFETTYAEQGVGLAAPQVGVSKRWSPST